ncbi:DUF4012 domain-containing protein [Microbispora catharanthi]|uniref:DUF4012 domain-containing protein n=1 Tax=Microbispora catharanthi TaxID=1712871 RepID=A0A5N6C392_9ACTN|nr:DUF4012 domain-containing protein [Microbispora catharanthi]KAB8187255.1 DUF4012 domain-containing protein [Microbispora catharanthi]
MPRRRKRRLVVAGLPSLALGLVLAGGWSVHLGLSVRDHLEATRDALLRLRTARLASPGDSLGVTLADARRHAAEAWRLTSGPDWALLTHVPLVGDAATTIRGLAWAAAEFTDVLAGVQRAAAPLMPGGGALAGGDQSRTLEVLDALAPVLDRAGVRIAAARSQLAHTPARTGLEAVNRARDTLLRETGRIEGWVGAAANVAALAPPMLGRDGPRRYFLAFQTNAEARGTGGLVGAFGILTADRGKLAIARLSANNGLASSSKPVADYGPRFLARYGPGATTLLSVSNLSPHFPYAASTWAGLWRRQTGQSVDGAIATDPVGLARMLEIVGPVRLPGGETVTAGNVVDLTERVAYERYPDPAERKKYLIRIAAAVSEALIGSDPQPARLLPVLSRLAAERRVQIWNRREDEERRLAATPLGGVLPERPGPYAALVVNNSAGTKLDYYLGRSLTYELGPCRPDGMRQATVRIGLANDVPRGQLPGYVTDRLDSPRRPHVPGSNLLWVSLYGAVGAEATGMRVDGRPSGFYTEYERSHPIFSSVLEFAPRQTRTVELDLLEPYSAAAPVVPVQPLVRPQDTVIRRNDEGCPAR